jgi:Tol biopolymer transport system component
MALLIGGVYLAREQLQAQLGDVLASAGLTNFEQLLTAVETPTSEPTTTPSPTSEVTPTLEVTSEATSEPAEEGNEISGANQAPVETSTPEPKIGPITFARGATGDYQPIDPGVTFEGEVREVHAIFDYSGLSPTYTWERVWFHDGTEMLRSAEAWSGAEEGVFDYYINAAGEPLSPGTWLLELYIEGNLLAMASFTIIADQKPELAATEEPQPESTALAGTGWAQSPVATPEPSEQAPDVRSNVSPATPTPVPPTPTPQPQKYKLAYTKWNMGVHHLYIGDTNGESEQFIIGRAAGPSWTPDGQFLFFFGEEGIDRQEIEGVEYVFDEISNGIVRVNVAPVPTNIGEVHLFQEKSWKGGTIRWANVSPNGQMVAYDARPGGNYRIYFLGTDENEQYKFEIIGEQADWSPDSEKLAYRSGRDGTTGIWISNRNDSGHTLITNNNDSFPDWSPDGRTIAFARDQDGNVDIYTMNVDGSNVKRLTESPGPDTLPVYTPDGQIIFRSARSGSWGIWKMGGDGSNQQQIILNAGVGPDWAYSRMSVLGR